MQDKEKLLILLAKLTDFHIGSGGFTDNECMSAGESATTVLEGQGLLRVDTFRHGEWTKTGLKALDDFPIDRNGVLIPTHRFERNFQTVSIALPNNRFFDLTFTEDLALYPILNAIASMCLQYVRWTYGKNFSLEQNIIDATAIRLLIDLGFLEIGVDRVHWTDAGERLLRW